MIKVAPETVPAAVSGAIDIPMRWGLFFWHSVVLDGWFRRQNVKVSAVREMCDTEKPTKGKGVGWTQPEERQRSDTCNPTTPHSPGLPPPGECPGRYP